jgi:hypothetical protein
MEGAALSAPREGHDSACPSRLILAAMSATIGARKFT